jgi:aquaporin Z
MDEELYSVDSQPLSHNQLSQYMAEFTGTYFLVLTVGFNVLTGSIGAAISIGAILTVMIYALGTVSGAHFNPAVTMAVYLSSRRLITLWDAICYILFQIAGAALAGATYAGIMGDAFFLAPVGRHTAMTAGVVEMLYTAALCYVVLNVATTRKQEGNNYFGLAIGFTVVSAALAIGGISGCCLNPAVCVGVTISGAFYHGAAAASHMAVYILGPLAGAGLSCVFFYAVQKEDEYSGQH